MSSKRHLRRKACEGKRRFTDYNEARYIEKQLIIQGDQSRKLNVYKCPFCHCYHVGHRSRGKLHRSTSR